MVQRKSPVIRRQEGARAAALLGGAYHCLEERDLLIFYHERPLERITRLLRTVRPRIVLTHSPADYMLDHEMTSTLVRAAVFGAPRRISSPGSGHPPALAHIPHLYYCDPIEGKDALGRPVEPDFRIDVSTVMDTKAAMLAAHASQREWLLKHHGMDQYVQSMRDLVHTSAADKPASPSPRAFASISATAIRKTICSVSFSAPVEESRFSEPQRIEEPPWRSKRWNPRPLTSPRRLLNCAAPRGGSEISRNPVPAPSGTQHPTD